MSSHRRGYSLSSRSSSSTWRQDDRRYDEGRRKRRASDASFSDDRREGRSRHDNGRSHNHHDHSSSGGNSSHCLHRSVWVGNLHNKALSSKILEETLVSELRSGGLLYRGYKGSPIVRCNIREDKHDAYVEFRSSQDATNCVKLDRKRVARGPLHGLRLHVSPWRDVDYLNMQNSKMSPSPSSKRSKPDHGQRHSTSSSQTKAPSQIDRGSGSDFPENDGSSVWARMQNRPPTPPRRLQHKVNDEIPSISIVRPPAKETSQSPTSTINSNNNYNYHTSRDEGVGCTSPEVW